VNLIAKRFLPLLSIFLLALIFTGCSSTPNRRTELPPPISMDEIKEMSAKGVSDQTIISALRATRAAYHLKSVHVTDLQQAGVSQPVIDYLLTTPQIFPPAPPPPYYYYYSQPSVFIDWPFYHDYHHHGHH
jgi:hypothetical protein